MMIARRIFFCLFFLSLSGGRPAGAVTQDISAFPELTSQDRVLVLAPHPDDEAIAVSGVIQRCLQNDIPIKIVYFTNGDNNELSFIVYEKRLVFRKNAFVYMGEVRRKEAIRSMAYLGLKKEDLVFLGYPDFGTMEIFMRYWDPKRPFRSMLTRVTSVPYHDSFSFGAPYAGQSIVNDLKAVIGDFKPTRIFVSHPADTNRDHRALYVFLRVALWDLEGKIPLPALHPYLVHVVRWPWPRGFRPYLYEVPPKSFKDSGIRWLDLELTEEEIWIKRMAISLYKSQLAYAPSYLYSFARQNELFNDFPPLELPASGPDLLWKDVHIFSEMDPAAEGLEEISALSYALSADHLFVRLTLKRRFNKNFGVFLYLFGYRGGEDFAQMPKIRISVGMRGIHVWDRFKRLRNRDVAMSYEGRCLIVKVPLELLGHPDRVLASVKTSSKDLPFDNTAWRLIFLKPRE